jgi:UPF0755 protein
LVKGSTGYFAGRTFLVAVGVLVLIVSAGLVTSLVIASRLDMPTASIGEEGLLFSVGQGESAYSVANRLYQQRAIRSDLYFRLIMKAGNVEKYLKTGEYRIKPDMHSSNILDMIVEGKQILVRLVIPEGATVRDVAKAAEIAGVATEQETFEKVYDKEFVKEIGLKGSSAAGYLFPDTYLLPKNTGAEGLIRFMVNNYTKRLQDAIPESSSLSEEDARKRLIVASIVEREYRMATEAPLIAGVFWNRLKIGMALQSCATVVYVITERLGKSHPARIFDRDLSIPDPFNTYLNPGLPPEPICNPGLTALSAAYRPAFSKFLYFRLVNENSGEHYFSETLDEHIKAAALTIKPGTR